MADITIRELDQSVIEELQTRAAGFGRSVEEEAKRILTDTVEDGQLARQRAWVARMRELRKEWYGDQVFPDSSDLFREMRDERTRQIEAWALPKPEK